MTKPLGGNRKREGARVENLEMVHPPQRSFIDGTAPGKDQHLLRASLTLGTNSGEVVTAGVASITISQSAESTVIELPPFAGIRIMKQVFHRADWTSPRPISGMLTEKDVETRSAELEPPQPPLSAIKFLMAEDLIVAKKTPKKGEDWKKL